jgi:thymidylate synthase ThyX
MQGVRSAGVTEPTAQGFDPGVRARLARHFTDLDGPVFALTDLPEVVKGALFARYSRSPKSLRRLFLDEFATDEDAATTSAADAEQDVDVARAERLYERVFFEYGDDSVAQLGGVHLAVEDASQLLAKVLERPRLAGYLEQSTRYIPYTTRPYRYHVPQEVIDTGLEAPYRQTLHRAFDLYARWLEPAQELYRERFPQDPADPDPVYRASIRAKALDLLRPMLPAATQTNIGIYASAQTYEQLLLHMRGHPLAEMRGCADRMLTELRRVIPAFLTRVDLLDRGGAWTEYLWSVRAALREVAGRLLQGVEREPRPEVTLSDWEADGETKVVAAALYEVTSLPDDQLMEAARAMSPQERADVLSAAVGRRTNRRHRPGRAFERTSYRFDVLCDYGAFRDIQRHRMLTIEWQRLTPQHGFELPPDVVDLGAEDDWRSVMAESAALHRRLVEACGPDVAQYAVSMAYRIRFVMQMNAREAMHLIELRSSPQGHPVYRRVAQQMHRLIRDEAGHGAIADAMSFVDHSAVDLERLEAERRTAAKRKALETSGQS